MEKQDEHLVKVRGFRSTQTMRKVGKVRQCNITFPLLNKLQFIDTCTDLGDRVDYWLDLS